MKLVECVPNFSEGRDRSIIDAITAEIERTEGVKLLDVDPGKATNRTVVTFIGSPESAKRAAFRAIKRASELIDMSKHQGAHARMGATDVCPFIPVSELTMADCVQLARELGEEVARELSIPVYLYEEAATRPERRNLATIRSGEYEGLASKLEDPDWRPDFGEPVFNARSGATVIGAREFLIAYNINLNTRRALLARKIANTIREKGRPVRDEQGNFVYDAEGEKVMEPGIFEYCKATGWYIDEYQCAQVTMNLTNYHVTPVHIVLERVRELAIEYGVVVTGSELVGLIPKQAMLDAGIYYLQKQEACAGVTEEELIRVAIRSMGLDQLTPFDPRLKIIEYCFQQDVLVARTIREFTNETSSDSPAPGGGSVAALAGALSAALSAMVANLTFPKKKFKEVQPLMDEVALEAQKIKNFCLTAIDHDTAAFNKLMSAFALPKNTEEENTLRERSFQEATREAIRVPLSVLEQVPVLLELAEKVVRHGNPNSLSDAGVATLMARASALGTYYNVLINLAGISDPDYSRDMAEKAEQLKDSVEHKAHEIEQIVSGRLKEQLPGQK
ncbi:glutamate formimidoyltransferase [bacterium]|nr:glutamate formimidoyltransferase [bacterium]